MPKGNQVPSKQERFTVTSPISEKSVAVRTTPTGRIFSPPYSFSIRTPGDSELGGKTRIMLEEMREAKARGENRLLISPRDPDVYTIWRNAITDWTSMERNALTQPAVKQPEPSEDQDDGSHWSEGKFTVERSKHDGRYILLGPDNTYESFRNKDLAYAMCELLNGNWDQADDYCDVFAAKLKKAP